MKRRDWNLLAIASAEQPMTPVQLQKSLFLIGEQLKDEVGDDYYEFRPYHYGPFDRAVYEDASDLVRAGLVKPVATAKGQGRWNEYVPTASGLESEDSPNLAKRGDQHIHRRLDQLGSKPEFCEAIAIGLRELPLLQSQQRLSGLIPPLRDPNSRDSLFRRSCRRC